MTGKVPRSLKRLKTWITARRRKMREAVYWVLAACLSLVLVIPFAIAIRPDFQLLANLQSISTALLTAEGILVGLAVLQKAPLSRFVTGFLSLMALLFSLDTLMLIPIVSQIQGANARTQVDVLPPFTISPLDLFFWNIALFIAAALSIFGLGIATEFYDIRLKKQKPPREK